jgi:hypothetical protein
VELSRGWRPFVIGPAMLALALVCFYSPALLAMVGRAFAYGDWVGYATGVMFLIAGLLRIAEARRPFAVRMDAQGVSWVKGRTTVLFPWADVARIAIEKEPNAARATKPSLLTVWTGDAVDVGLTPDVQLVGLRGYRLADVRDLRQRPDEIVAGLRSYAGDRYAAQSA